MSSQSPTSTKRMKKKVSFDIEAELADKIKMICEARELNLADFFRIAATEKVKIENKYMTIFVFSDGGGIKKLTIERDLYEIKLKEADKDMKDNVGAIMQGEISPLPGDDPRVEKYYDALAAKVGEKEPILEYKFYMDSTLEELFEVNDRVYFYTKMRY